MKALVLICTGLLFLGVANMPIGYYTLLRVVVSIVSVVVIVSEIEKGINIWVIIFGLMGILFNPLFPVYLNSKKAWIPIDIVFAILCGIKAMSSESKD